MIVSQSIPILYASSLQLMTVKVKVKYLHIMLECGRKEVKVLTFLTSVLGGDEWSASYPGRFTPSE